MIRSMTGFGRGECLTGNQRIVSEIKSVNGRYREVNVRLPKALQGIEDEIRSQVSKVLNRGRIEVSLQLQEEGGETEYQPELNIPLVKAYLKIFQQMREQFGIEEGITIDDLCHMKDVILMKSREIAMDQVRGSVQEALQKALDSCERMRVQEGQAIETDFLKRLDLIEKLLGEVTERAPCIVLEYQKKLREKILNLSKEVERDEGRMMQEVAILADRCDITEEIVRARSHLCQFRSFLGSEDAVGRKLEFLMQEIHREVNTMSNKGNDASISSRVVEIKAELEKLREQVQNVE